MVKIVSVIQDTLQFRPIQKRFCAPNIVIGSFVSPDTDALEYDISYGVWNNRQIEDQMIRKRST